ncbi:MAG: hypothetical protein GXO19_05350 [Epsilonproteobacteria bacterium]|nr:hypothetical protein [Campylobacterota bacterium]NPA57143.1 hypothetical protein [Campylobacterota bacterium]
MRLLFILILGVFSLFGARMDQEYINELEAYLTSRSFPIKGLFYKYDFNGNGEIEYNEWIYESVKTHKLYRLLGTEPTDINVFGFKEIEGVNLNGKDPNGFFVFIDFPLDRGERRKFSWIYLSMRNGCVYKLMGSTPDHHFDYLCFGNHCCDSSLTFEVEDGKASIVYRDFSRFQNIVDREDTEGFAWRLYRYGNRLFVADGSNGLVIFTIRENGHLDREYHLPLDGEQLYDLALDSQGKYAYLADGKGGIVVVDLKERKEVNRYLQGREVSRVVLDPSGKYLFAIVDEAEMVLFDVDGGELKNMRKLPVCTNPLDIYFCGEDMLVVDGCSGLMLWNSEDPLHPTLTVLYEATDLKNLTTYNGRYIIATTWKGDELVIYDSQERVGRRVTLPFPVQKGVVGDDGYLYTLDRSSSISVWSLDDPMSPKLVRKIYLPYPAVDLLIDSDASVAYVAEGGDGVLVIELP